MEKLIHYHLLVVLEGRNIPKTSLVSQSDQFFTDNHNPYDSVKNYKRRAEIENVVKIRSYKFRKLCTAEQELQRARMKHRSFEKDQEQMVQWAILNCLSRRI